MQSEELIEYISLLMRGKASRQQEMEIQRWLAEKEEHRQIFNEVCKVCYKLNYTEIWNKIDTGKSVRKVQKTITERSLIRKWGYGIATIAALIMIYIGIILFLPDSNPVDPKPLALAENGESGEMKAMLTLANGEKVELKAGMMADVDLGFARVVEDSLSELVYRVEDTFPAVLEYHTLSVPRAGEYIMVLPDGSRVWLNSETEMRYPVTFAAGKREVFLTGEAYFDVAKDKTRPFIVITPHTRTTALGTSFNVMAYQGETNTEITLVTGEVSVVAGKEQCHIVPGEQVSVNRNSLIMSRREVNTSVTTSWKDGIFDFDNMELGELCQKLGRWYDVDFFFVNRDAADKRFTGAVKRSRSLQFMLEFVQKTSGVRFVATGKTVSVYNK